MALVFAVTFLVTVSVDIDSLPVKMPVNNGDIRVFLYNIARISISKNKQVIFLCVSVLTKDFLYLDLDTYCNIILNKLVLFLT